MLTSSATRSLVVDGVEDAGFSGGEFADHLSFSHDAERSDGGLSKECQEIEPYDIDCMR